MPAWSPATWGDFSTVGLLTFIVILFMVCLLKGWLVIGRTHNEVIARSEKDAEVIRILSESVTARTAEDNVTARLLSAWREAAAREAVVGGEH